MRNVAEYYTTIRPVNGPNIEGRLREEIAFFEGRLLEMAQSGDCAYEKALARSYCLLLTARRGQLAALKAPSRKKKAG